MADKRDVNIIYKCSKCGFQAFFFDNYYGWWRCKKCEYKEPIPVGILTKTVAPEGKVKEVPKEIPEEIPCIPCIEKKAPVAPSKEPEKKPVNPSEVKKAK